MSHAVTARKYKNLFLKQEQREKGTNIFKTKNSGGQSNNTITPPEYL